MIKKIDDLLNSITMYRLVLYYLIALIGAAIVGALFGFIPYNPILILLSTGFLVAVSWITNRIFGYAFDAPTNVESVYITALILALIISPFQSIDEFIFLGLAAGLAIASKFIIAIGKKHIFNPAAIAVVLTAIGFGQTASWWVGNGFMAPFVVIGGLLLIRKMRREDLFFSFFTIALVCALAFGDVKGTYVLTTLDQVFLHSSVFFFGFLMLTEPLTTPPTKYWQMFYAGLVGFLFTPQVHLGSIYSTPELALVVGNVISYFISPKQKLVLDLKERLQTAYDSCDFLFVRPQKFTFAPGQYMEWTMPHKNPDSRGNRRYFTIASSPTENTLRLGVRFNKNSSSYKVALAQMNEKSILVASQLAGDFTLPKDLKQKLVFVAGGIGITPFRSMLKYLLDTKQRRDIVILYSAKNVEEFVYVDVLTQAQTELGVRVYYTITDAQIPANWTGLKGRINEKMMKQLIPDYASRKYFLSGPNAMVKAFEQILKTVGVSNNQIKKDYFPGF